MVVLLWLATIITINLEMEVIKTLFSEGAMRHTPPPGRGGLSLSGNYSNTHPPYVKV